MIYNASRLLRRQKPFDIYHGGGSRTTEDVVIYSSRCNCNGLLCITDLLLILQRNCEGIFIRLYASRI